MTSNNTTGLAISPDHPDNKRAGRRQKRRVGGTDAGQRRIPRQ